MAAEKPRSRIFISCGQSKESDEIQIAREIGNRLTILGFDPYIAVDVQDLRGLRENIFEQLRTSEYSLLWISSVSRSAKLGFIVDRLFLTKSWRSHRSWRSTWWHSGRRV